MAESTVFVDIYNGFAANPLDAATAAADGLIGAIAPELAAALSLFVIVNGVLVMLVRLEWNAAVLNCVRAVAVANLLTVGMYDQWVMQMYLVRLPGWIAGATNGADAFGMAEQFDKLRSAIDHHAGILWAATDAEGWGRMIADRASITFASQFDVLGLWLAFFIDYLAQVLMAVVAPAGAVLLVAYLFATTRRWAEGWIGKLVALLVLELLVAIELKITMEQFNAYMIKTEAAQGDLSTLISNFWGVGWVFLFGAAVMIALPAIAAAIGGSHVSSMVTAPHNTGKDMAARAAQSAGAPSAHAAANTLTQAIRRINRRIGQ